MCLNDRCVVSGGEASDGLLIAPPAFGCTVMQLVPLLSKIVNVSEIFGCLLAPSCLYDFFAGYQRMDVGFCD